MKSLILCQFIYDGMLLLLKFCYLFEKENSKGRIRKIYNLRTKLRRICKYIITINSILIKFRK